MSSYFLINDEICANWKDVEAWGSHYCWLNTCKLSFWQFLSMCNRVMCFFSPLFFHHCCAWLIQYSFTHQKYKIIYNTFSVYCNWSQLAQYSNKLHILPCYFPLLYRTTDIHYKVATLLCDSVKILVIFMEVPFTAVESRARLLWRPSMLLCNMICGNSPPRAQTGGNKVLIMRNKEWGRVAGPVGDLQAGLVEGEISANVTLWRH